MAFAAIFGGPRVGSVDAICQMRLVRARSRPKSERPVDMDPRASTVREIDQGSKGIKCTRVDLPRLKHDDAGVRATRESTFAGVRQHGPLRIGAHRHEVAPPESSFICASSILLFELLI